jgi:hypothetical protein
VFLTQLRERTLELASRIQNCESLRPYILWGDDEDVVIPENFKSDLPERGRFEPDKGHMDICKPTDYYLTPLEFIEKRMVKNAGRS